MVNVVWNTTMFENILKQMLILRDHLSSSSDANHINLRFHSNYISIGIRVIQKSENTAEIDKVFKGDGEGNFVTSFWAKSFTKEKIESG